ncbi:MAG: hypothetical protein H7Y04_06955 [Verrucomicrobia bacterium]|nr:hypothetical protein [Cytophagales bacterium]
MPSQETLVKNAWFTIAKRIFKSKNWDQKSVYIFKSDEKFTYNLSLYKNFGQPVYNAGLYFKYTALDLLFWEILGYPTYEQKPFHERLSGNIPAIQPKLLAHWQTPMDSDNLHERILSIAEKVEEIVASFSSYNLETYLDFIRNQEHWDEHEAHKNTVIVGYIFMDKFEKALEIIQDGKAKNQTGGVLGSNKTYFFDLAEAFCLSKLLMK